MIKHKKVKISIVYIKWIKQVIIIAIIVYMKHACGWRIADHCLERMVNKKLKIGYIE